MTETKQSDGRKTADDRRKRRHRLEIPSKPQPPWWRHPLDTARYYNVMMRWRLAVATTTHPVGVALAISMLVCTIPVLMLLNQSGHLKQQQAVDSDQQTQIADLLGEIQGSRKATTKVFCDNLNANARTNNAQLKLFQNIIVEGARSSLIFESLYRQYGAPPYATRVAQAEREAQKIERLKLPRLDCDKAVEEIERQTPRKPNPPIP